MQRRDRPVDEAVQEGIVQHVDMKMQYVEFGCESAHLVEHHDVLRDWVLDSWVEPEGDFARRLEPRGRAGIAAREQGDLMPLPHEFFGEIGDYPLRPTIEARRAAFGEGGDLCDLHRRFSFREFAGDRRKH
jgi:hypothetical protein